MVTAWAPAFAFLAGATLFAGCQRRGEGEAQRPDEAAPMYDDRAVSPTDPAAPVSTPNAAPPAASAAPSRPDAAEGHALRSGASSTSGAVESSAAHERLGGEYGARDTVAGASNSPRGGGGGGGEGRETNGPSGTPPRSGNIKAR